MRVLKRVLVFWAVAAAVVCGVGGAQAWSIFWRDVKDDPGYLVGPALMVQVAQDRVIVLQNDSREVYIPGYRDTAGKEFMRWGVRIDPGGRYGMELRPDCAGVMLVGTRESSRPPSPAKIDVLLSGEVGKKYPALTVY